MNDYEVGRLFAINCRGITFHLLDLLWGWILWADSYLEKPGCNQQPTVDSWLMNMFRVENHEKGSMNHLGF